MIKRLSTDKRDQLLNISTRCTVVLIVVHMATTVTTEPEGVVLYALVVLLFQIPYNYSPSTYRILAICACLEEPTFYRRVAY